MPKPPHPFASLTRTDAATRLMPPADALDAARHNRNFYDGRHFGSDPANGNGAYWVGPIPSTSDATYLDIKEEIRRIFCSRNAVKEAVDHTVDGVLGKPVMRRVTLRRAVTEEAPESPVEQALMDEAAALMADWAKRRKLGELLKAAYGQRLLQERVCARVYVPRGRLETNEQTDESRVPDSLSLADYLDMIFPHVTAPDTAGVETDEATQYEGGIYNYEIDKKEVTEIVYLDGDDTVIRTLRDDSEVADSEHRLNLGRRLTIYEPGLRSIISQQVRENQMALNLARTMQSKNVVMGGFLERVVTDAMPPGQWVQDPAFPDDPTKQIYRVGTFKVGAGTANFFMAAEYRDPANGETKFGSPRVYFSQPSPPDTFIAAARDYYQAILEEVGQAHILISGDATASGKSREQAERTYRRALEDDAGEIQALDEWWIGTALAMAYDFANRAAEFALLKIESACFIETGVRTAEQRREDREKVKAGHLSLETALRLDGEENPKAEMERIRQEQEANPNTILLRAQIFAAMGGRAGNGEAAAVSGLAELMPDVDLTRTDQVPAEAQ